MRQRTRKPRKSEKTAATLRVAFLLEKERNPNWRENVSREEVKAAIVECAQKLGHTPSFSELTKTVKISRGRIRRLFGTYARALSECNLEKTGGGHKLTIEILFRDWATAARALKKIPSISEYEMMSKYSAVPLRGRFGGWMSVARGLRQWAERQSWAEEWRDVLDMVMTQDRSREGAPLLYKPGTYRLETYRPEDQGPSPRELINRPLYGPLLRQGPLTHGPVNEAGVMCLFSAMAEALGFVIMRVQTEFPDCEAMRRVGEDRWQWVRIEFEYESRNFLKHQHDRNGCDLIVCWKHNWPECPLEVLELSEVVKRLGNRG